MTQSGSNRVILSAVAVGLLACSLPLNWMSIKNLQIDLAGTPFGNGGPFGEAAPQLQFPTLPGMQFEVTGLNGSITLGASLPIWLLVVAAVGATLIGMLNELRVASVPPLLPLVILGLVAVFLVAGIVATFSGDASLGIGYLLATAGMVLAVIQASTQLTRQRSYQATSTGVE
jgi:hypothetical protein